MGGRKQSSYTCYRSEQRKTNTSRRCYELVKTLLGKLPESERTIIILYYLGEASTEEIGKYLGVSANTVRSRFQRALKLLQEDEILLIQKVLCGVQISESVLENTMGQVSNIKPASVSVRKRFFFIFFISLVIAIVVVLFLNLLYRN